MALSFSVAHRNMRQMGVSFQDLYQGGLLQVWSGSAPGVDAAATGTLLLELTLASAARTAETVATALLTLSGGGSGTVDTLTLDGYNILGGAVTYDTSLAVTATAVATQINKFTATPFKVWAYSAAASADITIYMAPGHGASCNGLAMVCGSTTITTTINGGSADNMGEGAGGSAAGVTQVAGLTFAEVATGVLAKTGTWSGTVLATGTAGYFRYGGVNSPNTTSPIDAVPYQYPRIQGSVGLSGADLNFGTSLSLTIAQPVTCGTFQLTEPASG